MGALASIPPFHLITSICSRCYGCPATLTFRLLPTPMVLTLQWQTFHHPGIAALPLHSLSSLSPLRLFSNAEIISLASKVRITYQNQSIQILPSSTSISLPRRLHR